MLPSRTPHAAWEGGEVENVDVDVDAEDADDATGKDAEDDDKDADADADTDADGAGKDAHAAADVAAIASSVMKDENNALSAYLLAVIDTPPAFLRSL
jgi:hypothetical protein